MTTPKLDAAIVAAQARAVTVKKDATNSFQRYDYASAEAIIRAGVDALSSEGVAVVPGSMELQDGAILRREWLMIHKSGETRSAVQDWPVVPGKGRPLDKAYAGALTSSFAYFLRDLLCMDRVAPGDDDLHREDTPEPADRFSEGLRQAVQSGRWSKQNLIALVRYISDGKKERALQLNKTERERMIATLQQQTGAEWRQNGEATT